MYYRGYCIEIPNRKSIITKQIEPIAQGDNNDENALHYRSIDSYLDFKFIKYQYI